MPPKRTGAPYRRIVLTFWTDPDVHGVLSDKEKLLAAYLFTNQHSHPCGVYRIPPIVVMDELGFTRDEFLGMVDGPLATFVTYDRRTSEVFVHAMAEHQIDGNGLHGKDRRIQWVTTQLQLVHSPDLLHRFYARYGDWNLPWNVIFPDDDPDSGKSVENRPSPLNHAEREGAYDGAYDGASPGAEKARAKTRAETENVSKRHADQKRLNHAEREGAWEARARPSPSNSPSTSNNTAIKPPASADFYDHAQADPKRREIVHDSGDHETPTHPELATVWANVRKAVLDVWHHGKETVSLDRQRVGLGLEHRLVNDLLSFAKDPDLVVWIITEAPRRLGWDAEPRTLHWLIRGENFAEAESAYRRHRARTAPPPDHGVRLRIMPGPDEATGMAG